MTVPEVANVEQLLEDPSSVTLSTAPFDQRFPNTNQTKNCWQNYVDYYTCLAANNDEEGAESLCSKFKRNYKILCPNNWVTRWDEAREKGNFAADLEAGAGRMKNLVNPTTSSNDNIEE